MKPLIAPVWIDTPARLKQIVTAFAKRFNFWPLTPNRIGLHAYREQVCLIQISDGQNDYLIDPLAIKDLAPLGPIFADPAIEKVFHACEYDILCLKRDFGFQFANIFDTMIASRIFRFYLRGSGIDP